MKPINSNIETAYIFNALVKIYAEGNVSKLAQLCNKDRSYINRMIAGRHSISLNNLLKILRDLENDTSSDSIQLIINVIGKIQDINKR